jgi:hypothetical protein
MHPLYIIYVAVQKVWNFVDDARMIDLYNIMIYIVQ